MKIVCILLLFLTGCVNVNVNHYHFTVNSEGVKEEVTPSDDEVNQENNEEKKENNEVVPPIIIQQVVRPVLPIEPEEEAPVNKEVSFLDIVVRFKDAAALYELNYFTPISIYEIYGVNELLVEEFVGGNRIIEQGIYEAAVFKARAGMSDQVYQKVIQRQAFLLAQYPSALNVNQASIIRINVWIIYSVLEENQTLIDAVSELINQST